MKFHLVRSSGYVEEVSGGCFGCLGRTDSYSANPEVFDQVKEINTSNGMSTSTGWGCEAYSTEDPTLYLELRPSWNKEGGIGLHSLKTRLTMDYLVNRSPWKDVFANTLDEMYDTDVIRLHAQGISSELVISAGFVLRSLDRASPHLTFKALLDTAPDVPEFLRFFLSLTMSDLYRGQAAVTLGNYGNDGVIFSDGTSLSAILDPESHLESTLSGISLEDAHGYVMNIASMWRRGKGKLEIDTALNRVILLNSSSVPVQGVFGTMHLNGIVNLNKFCTELYELIRSKV